MLKLHGAPRQGGKAAAFVPQKGGFVDYRKKGHGAF